jgi:hypothetical protein
MPVSEFKAFSASSCRVNTKTLTLVIGSSERRGICHSEPVCRGCQPGNIAPQTSPKRLAPGPGARTPHVPPGASRKSRSSGAWSIVMPKPTSPRTSVIVRPSESAYARQVARPGPASRSESSGRHDPELRAGVDIARRCSLDADKGTLGLELVCECPEQHVERSSQTLQPACGRTRDRGGNGGLCALPARNPGGQNTAGTGVNGPSIPRPSWAQSPSRIAQ